MPHLLLESRNINSVNIYLTEEMLRDIEETHLLNPIDKKMSQLINYIKKLKG